VLSTFAAANVPPYGDLHAHNIGRGVSEHSVITVRSMRDTYLFDLVSQPKVGEIAVIIDVGKVDVAVGFFPSSMDGRPARIFGWSP
jgi:hypothetical protein